MKARQRGWYISPKKKKKKQVNFYRKGKIILKYYLTCKQCVSFLFIFVSEPCIWVWSHWSNPIHGTCLVLREVKPYPWQPWFCEKVEATWLLPSRGMVASWLPGSPEDPGQGGHSGRSRDHGNGTGQLTSIVPSGNINREWSCLRGHGPDCP